MPSHNALHNAVEIPVAHCLVEISDPDLRVVGRTVSVEFLIMLVLHLIDFLLLQLYDVGQLNLELVREASVVGAHHLRVLLGLRAVEV